MLNFNINLYLPSNWVTKKGLGQFFLFDESISKNKALSVQIEHFNWTSLFGFSFDLTLSGSDHAGLFVDFTILGLCMIVNLYDKRHWDYENNSWEKIDITPTNQPE